MLFCFSSACIWYYKLPSQPALLCPTHSGMPWFHFHLIQRVWNPLRSVSHLQVCCLVSKFLEYFHMGGSNRRTIQEELSAKAGGRRESPWTEQDQGHFLVQWLDLPYPKIGKEWVRGRRPGLGPRDKRSQIKEIGGSSREKPPDEISRCVWTLYAKNKVNKMGKNSNDLRKPTHKSQRVKGRNKS
jgi:hypothetical protein